MTINGRLLLLVVVTAMFVRVWSANECPHAPCPARSRSQISCIEPHHDQVDPSPCRPLLSQPVSVTSRASATSPSDSSINADPRPLTSGPYPVWTMATCPIPLPVGIGSGAYRMV